MGFRGKVKIDDMPALIMNSITVIFAVGACPSVRRGLALRAENLRNILNHWNRILNHWNPEMTLFQYKLESVVKWFSSVIPRINRGIQKTFVDENCQFMDCPDKPGNDKKGISRQSQLR